MTPENVRRLWEKAGPDVDMFSWLNSIGLYRKHVIRDPCSLFRATSESIYSTQRLHQTIRQQCMRFLKDFGKAMFKIEFDMSTNQYIDLMLNLKSHGGFNEIAIMTRLFKRDFIIFNSDEGPNFTFCKNYGESVMLFYQPNINHFDIVIPMEYVKISALCQSIMYTAMYEGVFRMSDVEDASNKMLFDVSFGVESYVKEDIEKDRKNVMTKTNKKNVKSERDLKKISNKLSYINRSLGLKNFSSYDLPPFSYKVARGISPYVYKNLEVDMWIEFKREEDNALMYNDGRTLQVGVKCLCKLDTEQTTPYNCYIQAMKLDGTCEVYIQELGLKKVVDLNQLEPLPLTEAKPWYSSNKKAGIKISRKYNTKRKKAVIAFHDVAKYLVQKNYHFKTRVVENRTEGFRSRDSNNNNKVKVNEVSSCLAEEWNHSDLTETDNDNIHCLEKYTQMDYLTFKPYPVEYVTMPIIVEQTSNNTNANRDSSNNSNRQSVPYPGPVPVSSASNGNAPYQLTANNTEVNGSIVSVTSSSPASTSQLCGNSAVVYANGNNHYSTYPVYCIPPFPIPNARPGGPLNMPYTSRPPSGLIPNGVNVSVQRSINMNGSDLPYNDIPTLRFFFNMGLEWMHSSGCIWPPMPPPPPPTTPVGAPHGNYYYQSPVTPNHLALDLQNNLNLDDSPNNPNTNNEHRTNNNQVKYNGTKHGDFRNGRGGSHNQKSKRNDSTSERTNYKNNQNYNNRSNFNNNKKNNFRGGNFNNENREPPNQERNDQDQSSLDVPVLPPPSPSFISYPPPPFVRLPYYVGDGDVPCYNPNFGPYGLNNDEMNNQAMMDGMFNPPPAYMSFHQPPPVYYPPSNMTTYYPYVNSPQNGENQPK